MKQYKWTDEETGRIYIVFTYSIVLAKEVLKRFHEEEFVTRLVRYMPEIDSIPDLVVMNNKHVYKELRLDNE